QRCRAAVAHQEATHADALADAHQGAEVARVLHVLDQHEEVGVAGGGGGRAHNRTQLGGESVVHRLGRPGDVARPDVAHRDAVARGRSRRGGGPPGWPATSTASTSCGRWRSASRTGWKPYTRTLRPRRSRAAARPRAPRCLRRGRARRGPRWWSL